MSEHYEDVGRRGPSVGDSFTFSDRLFHRGERVGRDHGKCDVTRTGPDLFAFQCVVTVKLRGRGQIALQGVLAFRRGVPDRNEVIAITGGTGVYAGASGKGTLMDKRGEPTRLQIRLR